MNNHYIGRGLATKNLIYLFEIFMETPKMKVVFSIFILAISAALIFQISASAKNKEPIDWSSEESIIRSYRNQERCGKW